MQRYIFILISSLISYTAISSQTKHDADSLGQQLLARMRIGDFAAVERLIDQGANLEVRDTTSQKNPLLRAIEEAPSDVVFQLLQAGANPDAQDNLQCTALQRALTAKRMDLAIALACAGANLDAPCNDELSGEHIFAPLLFKAVFDGNTSVIRWLFVRGASPLTTSDIQRLKNYNIKPECLVQYESLKGSAIHRLVTITQCIEGNGFPRDITRLFWDIAGLPEGYKPAAEHQKRLASPATHPAKKAKTV